MKSVKSLKDLGRGRTCIIIGGGISLNQVDLDNIPDDFYIISCNAHYPDGADMVIYYDADMQKYYLENELEPTQLLLGFRHSNKLDHTNKNCTHFYSYQDILFGDTGFHALQFADQLFNFSTIYLAGYDYYTVGGSYHHNELESDPIAMGKFRKWSIGKVLDKYKDIRWKNTIYNVNKDSGLKLFKHKLFN